MIRIISSSNRIAVSQVLSADRIRDRATQSAAARIVDSVRHDGDAALKRYARQLDGLTGSIEMPRSRWQALARQLPDDVRVAIRRAARNIRAVAKRQVPKGWRHNVAPGITVSQRVTPLARVGCYVPAGRYPLPSSLLMTAVPARAAGVGEVIVCCPRPDAAVYAAALEAGADRLFRVDKIVGPGNRWVSAAKSLVAADCGIDFYAGPTEVLIITASGPPAWIAADLLAQAEHDPDARALLITTSSRLAARVADEVAKQMPSSGPAKQSIARHGGIIVCRTMSEAIALANEAAAEHVVTGNHSIANKVVNAGAIFVGAWTAQAGGDYAIGSNHVLPTAGAARFRGGLNAADFVKLISVQCTTRAGLKAIGKTIATLARAEGLEQHARSIEVRQQ